MPLAGLPIVGFFRYACDYFFCAVGDVIYNYFVFVDVWVARKVEAKRNRLIDVGTGLPPF